MRKCIGSARFEIEPHEAPVGDFPTQPSQKDGLGRMCKPHWTEYTRALRKDSVARKADGGAAGKTHAAKTPSVIDRLSQAAIEAGGTVTIKRVRRRRVPKPEPIRTRPARGRKTESDLVVEAVTAGGEGLLARAATEVKEASIT